MKSRRTRRADSPETSSGFSKFFGSLLTQGDLSRFGREHVMMDYYLEFLFPEKRVRYIAVAENEDTEKGLSDFVPFKNLFNDSLA